MARAGGGCGHTSGSAGVAVLSHELTAKKCSRLLQLQLGTQTCMPTIGEQPQRSVSQEDGVCTCRQSGRLAGFASQPMISFGKSLPHLTGHMRIRASHA